jgi:hypothetical protein
VFSNQVTCSQPMDYLSPTLEQGPESAALLSQAWTFRRDLLKVTKTLTFQHSIDLAITPKQG